MAGLVPSPVLYHWLVVLLLFLSGMASVTDLRLYSISRSLYFLLCLTFCFSSPSAHSGACFVGFSHGKGLTIGSPSPSSAWRVSC